MRTKTRVTANHMGWFEFSLCVIKDGKPATENCFVPLISKDVARRPVGFKRPKTKWQLSAKDGTGEFDIEVQLPPTVTCQHCVLRMFWNCGNFYGNVAD